MKIIATNIGEKKTVLWKQKPVTTGIYKYPVTTPIFLGTEEVANDVVYDRKYHGGVDQAVYAYAYEHYPYFKNLYPNLDWHFGIFGENLTLDSLDETRIRVGNRYAVGGAIIVATKPRQPCRVLGIRFGDMSILKHFWNSTKSGVYFKVVQTGFVQVGDTLELLTEATENPTIAAVYALKRNEKKG